MGSMAGTFTIPEFNWPYTITDSNLVRIGDKKFLEKNHVPPPPFYIIFTSENHLNAHSSLIKQHMAMNFAPLDCPCEGASSESKKIYLDFSVLEKFAKNQKKNIFLAPTAKNGFNGRNFYYTWIQLTLYNNWQQFGSNRRQKISRKKPCTPCTKTNIWSDLNWKWREQTWISLRFFRFYVLGTINFRKLFVNGYHLYVHKWRLLT
jgi:hypothetical protein